MVAVGGGFGSGQGVDRVGVLPSLQSKSAVSCHDFGSGYALHICCWVGGVERLLTYGGISGGGFYSD